MMTAKGIAGLGAALAVLTLSACASPEEPAATSPALPPQVAPQVSAPRPQTAAPTAAPPASRPSATVAPKDPHKAYLDQRTGRHYYFDQTTHRYYWDDGTPRY
jgi:hypothetical protein